MRRRGCFKWISGTADVLDVWSAEVSYGFRVPTLYQGANFMRVSRFLLALFLGLLVISGTGSGADSPLGWAVAALIFVCIASAWEMRSRHMGLRFESGQVVAVYAINSISFPISEVAGFSLHLRGPSGGTHTAYVELVNGKRKAVPSVSTADWGPFKSSAISWPGGSTSDVVGRLTEHLQALRQTARSAPDFADMAPR